MNMRFEQLEYILKSADLGSISSAAQELHMSQPAVSAAIAALEEEYHIQVFYRTRVGVQPTERGQQFLQHARDILNSVRELDSISSSDHLSGTLKIATVPGINYSILPPTLSEFIRKYPYVQTEMEECGSHAVKRSVDNNTATVGLCSSRNLSELDNGNYVYHFLLEAQVMACVSRNHPLTAFKKLNISKLQGYPLIIFNRNFRGYTYIISLLSKLNSPNIILTTSSFEVAKTVLADSSAIGFFSNILLSNDPLIRSGTLVAIPLEEETRTEFITLQKTTQVNNPIGRAFIQEVRRQAAHFSALNTFATQLPSTLGKKISFNT